MGYIVKYGYDGRQHWIHTLRDDDIELSGVTAVEDGYVAVGYYKNGIQIGQEAAHHGDLEGIPMGGTGVTSWKVFYSGGLLVKYDLDGNRKWITTIPSDLSNSGSGGIGTYFYQVTPCPDGGFVCVGWYGTFSYYSYAGYHSVPGPTDGGRAILVKTDGDGNILWRSELSGDGLDIFSGVCTLKDGTIIAVGATGGAGFGSGDWQDIPIPEEDDIASRMDAIAAAYTQNGDLLWKRTYQLTDARQHFFRDVIPLEGGGFAAAGERQIFLPQSSGDMYEMIQGHLACFGADGTPQWHSTYDGGSDKQCSPFVSLAPADNGVIVVFDTLWNGQLEGLPLLGGTDCVAMKYDLENGQLVWKKSYTSRYMQKNEWLYAYALTPLGNRKYALCGHGMLVENGYGMPQLPEHSILFIFYDESTPYHTVSGNVGLSGVSIGGKLSDGQGNYTVKVMEGESVTLTPSLPGYTFSEPSRDIGPVTGAVTGVDFEPIEIRYTIRGRILDANGSPLAGVTVAKEVVTGADGCYSLTVRPGSAVLLEPQLEGKTFEPSVITRSRVDEDEDNLDFRILKPRYTISGKVTREGKGQGGVEVFKGILTEPDGTYLFTAEEGSVLTLTPRFKGYKFEPSSRNISAVEADLTGQDFSMKPTTVVPDKPDPDKPDPEEPDDPKPSTPSTGGGSGGGHSIAPPKGETPTQATHAAYLQGYPDGCFHPDDTLTRAQCAAMLSRLDPAFDPERVTVSLPFSDTGAERWFAPYLSFCHHKGLVRGYPDGTFRPDGAMTRGEFASVVRNALALESAGEEFFPDTETHWARYPIAQLVQAGILDGYPDGTFRPDEPITRAEAAKVLNRVWQRPGTEGHLAEVPAPEYPDLPQSHWAYWEIWEASVSHPAEKK